MSDDFLGGIRRWLDKSGHAFELRVARAFRQGGAKPVALSFPYIDVNTGALREGDVLAQFAWTAMNDVPASIEVVVECKSGTDHPWVAFVDRSLVRGSKLADWTYFAHGPFTGVTQPLDEVWVGYPPFDVRQEASHLVAAHTGDSRNPAGDAVRQVLSAAEGRRKRYLDRQNVDPRGCVVVPVVVTASRLVECRLDKDGEVDLQEVTSLVVAGLRPGERAARVFVLAESAVPEFSAALAELARRAHEEARFPG